MSCVSPAYEYRWHQAASSAAPEGIEGTWDGTWQSEVNGHHGRLRCIIGPAIDDSSHHPFRYRATWMRFLSGGYRAEHQVTPIAPDQWTFSGQHQLPNWAGGLYQYEGTIHDDTMSVRYDCAIDRGHYELTRTSQP